MSDLILTEGQQTAYKAFAHLVNSHDQDILVIEGYAGTGKTTLVKYLLEKLVKLQKAARLINPEYESRQLLLTATTNQAAESFSKQVDMPVATIHSTLGLRVKTDFRTGKTELLVRPGVEKTRNALIFIDEASYIDRPLLKLIHRLTENCKLVFIGDPAQLLNVGSFAPTVFQQDYPTVRLTEVVRQAKGNPIIDLATQFRNTVNTGQWPRFTPDGEYIRYLPRDQFQQAYMESFQASDWAHGRSRVLAWRNKTVVKYNKEVRAAVKGAGELYIGDRAVVNQYARTRFSSLTTDQLVLVTKKSDPVDNCGVEGHWFTLDNTHEVFVPNSIEDRKARLRQARDDEEWELARIIEEEWVDLRAIYASTINKAQGTTLDEVFIDLDDLKDCRSGNQIARMLYVGVSRARHRVNFTGDLV